LQRTHRCQDSVRVHLSRKEGAEDQKSRPPSYSDAQLVGERRQKNECDLQAPHIPDACDQQARPENLKEASPSPVDGERSERAATAEPAPPDSPRPPSGPQPEENEEARTEEIDPPKGTTQTDGGQCLSRGPRPKDIGDERQSPFTVGRDAAASTVGA